MIKKYVMNDQIM